MRILCIDIGIKNLAFCIVETNSEYKTNDTKLVSILLWDNFNTLEQQNEDCNVLLCNSILKNGYKCKSKGKFVSKSTKNMYCTRHKIKDCTIIKSKKVKIKNILLQDITENVLKTLNNILNTNNELFNTLDNIYIELQPKVNNKMKLISHITYAKLCDYYLNNNYIKTTPIIRFISATKKLQIYNGPYIECKYKNKYSQRKWLSIEYCKYFLSVCNSKFIINDKEQYYKYLINSDKKDDLCDTLLMCLYTLK